MKDIRHALSSQNVEFRWDVVCHARYCWCKNCHL
jgi:hypothetical protein